MVKYGYGVAIFLILIVMDSNGQILPTGHSAEMDAIAISPDHEYLISGDERGEVILWDYRKGIQLKSFHFKGFKIAQLQFVPGTDLVLAQMESNGSALSSKVKVSCLNLKSGDVLHESRLADTDNLVLCRNNQAFAAKVYNAEGLHSVVLVDVFTGTQIDSIAQAANLRLVGKSADAKGIVIGTVSGESTKGTTKIKLASWSTQPVREKVFRNGGELLLEHNPVGVPYSAEVLIATNEDGSFAVVRDPLGHIHVLRAREMKKVYTIADHYRDLKKLIVTKNFLIRVFWDGECRIWDLIAEEEVAILGSENPRVSAICMSGDSNLLITNGISSSSFRTFNVVSGSLVRNVERVSSAVFDARLSKDEKYIVVKSAFRPSRAIEIATGKLLPAIPHGLTTDLSKSNGTVRLTVIKKETDHSLTFPEDRQHENYFMIVNQKTSEGLAFCPVYKDDWVAVSENGYVDGSPEGIRTLLAHEGIDASRAEATLGPRYKPGLAKDFFQRLNDHEVREGSCEIIADSISNTDPVLNATIVWKQLKKENAVINVFFNGHLLLNTTGATRKDHVAFSTDEYPISISVKGRQKESLIKYGEKNHFEIKVYEKNSLCKTLDIDFVAKHKQVPRLIVPFGHSMAIRAITLTSDKRFVLTGSDDNNVKLWDVQTGKELSVFEGPEGGVKGMLLMERQSRLIIESGPDVVTPITSSKDNRMTVWDFHTGKQLNHTYDRNQRTSVCGGFRLNCRNMQLTDVMSGQTYKLPASLGEVSEFAIDTGRHTGYFISRDAAGEQIFCTYDYRMRKMLDHFRTEKLQSLLTASPHSGTVLTVEGKEISLRKIVVSAVNVFENGPNPVKRIDSLSKYEIVGLHWSGHDELVYTILYNGDIGMLNVSTGVHEIYLKAERDKLYSKAVISGDGESLLLGTVDGETELWDLVAKTKKQTFKNSIYKADDVRMDLTGRSLILSSKLNDKAARLFNFVPGESMIPLHHKHPVAEASFSNDSRYVLTRTDSNSATLWERASGKLMRTFSKEGGQGVKMANFDETPNWIVLLDDQAINGVHRRYIWDIEADTMITPPEKIIFNLVFPRSSNRKYKLHWGRQLSGRWDGVVRFQNLVSNTIDFSLALLDGLDWVFYTYDGYYMSSKQGAKKLYFEQEGQVYNFQQFDLEYNRPDIILKRLGSFSDQMVKLYERAYHKRLEKVGLHTNAFSDRDIIHAPRVTLIHDQHFTGKTAKKHYKFSIRAVDTLFQLKEVSLQVNGVPVHLGLPPSASGILERETDIELSYGKNLVTVSVLNDKGVSSLTEQFEIDCQAEKRKPNLYIISIGADKYKDSGKNLPYPGKDANDVLHLFSENATKYGEIFSVLLTGEQASVDRILAQRELLQSATVDDEVIVFYAGHGMLDQKMDYFLACYTTDFSKPASESLSYDQLIELMEGIPSRKKIVIIDACYSGEIDRSESFLSDGKKETIAFTRGADSHGSASSAFQLMKDMFVDVRQQIGTTIVAASAGVELAHESNEWENGAFTHALIDGIRNRKADIDHDGVIKLDELQAFLRDVVSSLTKGRQHPSARMENAFADYTF